MTEVQAPLGSRIPFRIRVGVTGHRDVGPDGRLAGVPSQVRRLVPESDATRVLLGAVSELAEGADRLVVEALFEGEHARGDDARLDVVLPFERQLYVELQDFSDASTAEFDSWMSRATSVVELNGSPKPAAQDASYEAASRYLVNRCDVLVALWRGRPSGGRGGTAETLLYAATLGKPCIWIPAEPGLPASDNIGDGRKASFLDEVRNRAHPPSGTAHDERAPRARVLKPLEEAYRALDEFNRASLPSEPELRSRLEDELGNLDPDSDWVAGPFVRAAVLADRYESRFTLATWLMWLLATAASVCLGVSAALTHGSKPWAWAEVGCLVALLVVFAAARRVGLHRRWLTCRLLAERLRSAYFIAPTGIDFRRSGGLETVFVERQSADWLLRAFEEVWDSRPGAIGPPRTPSPVELDDLKRRLADEWVGGQVEFHRRAQRSHERRGRALTSVIVVLIAGGVLSALLHAWTHGRVEEIATFLSITLPVTAAALGAILTVRQHRALAERYARMHSDLLAVRESLLDADVETIGKAASEAARVIAEESGDWFGAMWFLDVEEPP